MATSQSNSFAVIESITYRNFLIFRMLYFSLSLLIRLVPTPGNRDIKELREPSLRIDSNWPLRSLMLNSPFFTFSKSLACVSGVTTSVTFCINCLISPSPSNLLMKDSASKGSKSSKCYPSPKNMMGD